MEKKKKLYETGKKPDSLEVDYDYIFRLLLLFFSAYSNVFVYLRAHQNNKRKFPSTVILPHIFLVSACLSLQKKKDQDFIPGLYLPLVSCCFSLFINTFIFVDI